MRVAAQGIASLTFVAGLGIGFFAGRSVESEAARAVSPASATPRSARPAATERGAERPRLVPGTAPAGEIAGAAALVAHAPRLEIAPRDAHAHDEDDAPVQLLDEKQLADAIARLKTSIDQDELARTAATLAAGGGKTATDAAVAILADRGGSPTALARRASALLLLAGQEEPAARGPALDALANESDETLRLAALSALQSSKNATPEESSTVSGRLATLVERDPDPEVRRRAVRALARWRSSDGDLAPLLLALEHDADDNVRGACCYALEDERVRSPAAVSALTRVLADARTARFVRELAAEALGRLGPLDPTARQAIAAFEREQP